MTRFFAGEPSPPGRGYNLTVETPPADHAEQFGRMSALILLALVTGITGVLLIMWVMQVWRRSLKRSGHRRRSAGDDTDPWRLAARRLDAGDGTPPESPENDV